MVILITGASSYVGAGIYVYLGKEFDVVGTYNSNKLFPELLSLDITDRNQVEKLIAQIKPEWVIHAAGNANARWCDQNKDGAVAINEEGTKNIVDAANTVGAKVIFISSFAAYYPVNVYSNTKIAGEEAIKAVKAGYDILRPSLIVGISPNTTNDRPFNRFLKNITEKMPASYDNSWKFQPTWLKHISEVIEEIIQRDITSETIPISVPQATTRYDLAKDLLTDFGVDVKADNKDDKTPSHVANLNKLEELKLPQYTYEQMISGIKQEIKEYIKSIS